MLISPVLMSVSRLLLFTILNIAGTRLIGLLLPMINILLRTRRLLNLMITRCLLRCLCLGAIVCMLILVPLCVDGKYETTVLLLRFAH